MPTSHLPSLSHHLASLRRGVVAASIAIAALLNLSVLIAPSSSGSTPGVQLFLFAQVFWAIGLVGLGHLASRSAPILGTVGAVLAALGVFGHAVYGGARMLMQVLPADAVAAASEVAESAPFVPFLALGLFGTVLGYLLLGIAVIRARLAPLWVPILLFAWLVAEFALSDLTPWSPYASITLGAVVFITLAAVVWRSPSADWRTEREAQAAVAVGNGGEDAPVHLARPE